MTLEKILFGTLVASPVIALIFLISRFLSGKKPVGNDAPYYSFWLYILILGLAFDFFGYLNSMPSYEYRVGLATTWNFVANLNVWFVKVPFVAISVFSFFKIKSSSDKSVEDEVLKFLISVAWPTAFVLFIWYFVVPTANFVISR